MMDWLHPILRLGLPCFPLLPRRVHFLPGSVRVRELRRGPQVPQDLESVCTHMAGSRGVLLSSF